MSKQKIRSAAIEIAKTRILAHKADAKISWPNVSFTPPQGIWFEVFYSEISDRGITCGLGGENEVEGIIQITVNVPLDSGEKATMDALNALESWFTPGQSYIRAGQEITVRRASRHDGFSNSAVWKTPLSVYIYGRYARPALV